MCPIQDDDCHDIQHMAWYIKGERQSKGREVTRSQVCPPRVGEARRFSCKRAENRKKENNGNSTSA